VGVTLTDVIPAGATFQSVTPSAGCATPSVGSTGTVTCALGTLANGATANVTLIVNVTAASGSVVSNTPSLGALTPDPNRVDKSATPNPNVVAPGSISGTVCANAAPPCVVGPNPPIQGATITVRNSDNGFGAGTATTDASGNYSVNGLFPRNYKVSAEANNFATPFFNNQTHFTASHPLPIT